MLQYLIKRPMLFAALLGAAAAVLVVTLKEYCIAILLFVAALTLILCLVKVRVQLKLACVLMLFISISSVFYLREISHISNGDGIETGGRFAVVSSPVKYDRCFSAELKVLDCDALPKGTRISAFYYGRNLFCGDCIYAEIELKSLETSKYKYGYYSRGIFLEGSLKDIRDTGQIIPFYRAAGLVRKYITDTITAGMPKNEAATMCAVIIGEKSFMSDEFEALVKRCGVSHVFVVSGMHLAIIMTTIFKITGKLFYSRIFRAGVSILAVLFFAAVCGFTMSILRAGLTYILMTLAPLLRRENESVNSLGTAVVAILICSPLAVFNISFQLSVLSTFGILVFAPAFTVFTVNVLKIKGKILTGIISAVYITLSAMLMTMPVVIYIYESVSVISPIVNLLISFAVTAALVLTAAGLAVSTVSPIAAELLFFFGALLARYMNYIINYFGRLPFAAVSVGRECVIASVCLILIAFWLVTSNHNFNPREIRSPVTVKKHFKGGLNGGGAL